MERLTKLFVKAKFLNQIKKSHLNQKEEELQQCQVLQKNANQDALKHLAVAANNGIVTIRDIDWAQIDKKQAGSLDRVKTTLF